MMGRKLEPEYSSGKRNYDLGMDFERQENYEEAIQHYINAFEEGYEPAEQKLCLYQDNQQNEQDRDPFMSDYKNKLEEEQLILLAFQHLTGMGRPKNTIHAFLLFDKASKINPLNKLVLYSLASSYAKRSYAKQNSNEKLVNQAMTRDYLTRAAKQGYAPAQYRLGLMYEEVVRKKDVEEAVKLYTQAAKQGHTPAQSRLDSMAKQGYAPAQYRLGLMVEQGKVVKKNEQQAILLFIKAAEQGYTPAQAKLDQICKNCMNVSDNQAISKHKPGFKNPLNIFRKTNFYILIETRDPDAMDLNAFTELLIPLVNTAPNECSRLLRRIHACEIQQSPTCMFFKNSHLRLSKDNFNEILCILNLDSPHGQHRTYSKLM